MKQHFWHLSKIFFKYSYISHIFRKDIKTDQVEGVENMCVAKRATSDEDKSDSVVNTRAFYPALKNAEGWWLTCLWGCCTIFRC